MNGDSELSVAILNFSLQDETRRSFSVTFLLDTSKLDNVFFFRPKATVRMDVSGTYAGVKLSEAFPFPRD